MIAISGITLYVLAATMNLSKMKNFIVDASRSD